MQNIVKMTAFLTHFDYIETYRKVRDEFIQEPFLPIPPFSSIVMVNKTKSAGSKCILLIEFYLIA